MIAREIDRDSCDRLFDLLSIEKANEGSKVKKLSETINRAKASMTKEQIAWVEKLVNEQEE